MLLLIYFYGTSSLLKVCNDYVFIFCFTLLLAATFTAQDVKWHPYGNALLIISRDQMCVCFLTDSEDVTS